MPRASDRIRRPPRRESEEPDDELDEEPEPPARSWLRRFGVLVVALLLVGGIAGVGYILLVPAPKSSAPQVTIDGITWTVAYPSGESGFFGNASQNGCPTGCPTSVVPGDYLDYSFTIPNYSNSTAHSVTAVSVAAPFHLTAIRPALPQTVPANGTLPISFSIVCPTTPGTYTIEGTIEVA